MNIKKPIPRILSLLLAISMLGLIGLVIFFRTQTENNNAPNDSNAIFGGRLENGYEFAGYVISDKVTSIEICSAIIVSPTQAITAAHCLDNDGQKFVGIGSYTSEATQYYNVDRVVIHPNWLTFNKIGNDLGIIILKDPIILDQYAEIAQPEAGCNYVVVGYGKQSNLDSFTPLRKSTDVCIESTDYLGNAISFSGRQGGLCFGDSGSAVFEKGTNKFVTIASSIDSCYINNFAAGAQIYQKINLRNSSFEDSSTEAVQCGYIDTQNNGVIDKDDLKAFVGDYLKYCDNKGLNITLQCGLKDSNQDNVINLVDLGHFAKLYTAGTCL